MCFLNGTIHYIEKVFRRIIKDATPVEVREFTQKLSKIMNFPLMI